jgi:hypothetical protein
MAIDDEDIKDREVWTGVSRQWYSKASDKTPTTGRLYHHLSILARPNAIQQLFFYTKSLSVAVPFYSARESILTLFDPLISGSETRPFQVETDFVRLQALFSARTTAGGDYVLDDFLRQLENPIVRQTERWLEVGAYVAICNGNALLEYGSASKPIMKIISSEQRPVYGVSRTTDKQGFEPGSVFKEALSLSAHTDELIFRRFGDPNVLPYVHCRLVFMHHLLYHPDAMDHVTDHFTWRLLIFQLNILLQSANSNHHDRVEAKEFPRPVKGDARPLPEDWALRGLIWTERLFPLDFFKDKMDDEDKAFEIPPMSEARRRRILCPASCMAGLLWSQFSGGNTDCASSILWATFYCDIIAAVLRNIVLWNDYIRIYRASQRQSISHGGLRWPMCVST